MREMEFNSGTVIVAVRSPMKEDGQPQQVRLNIIQKLQKVTKSINIDLAHYTADEVRMLRTVFDHVLDEAERVAEEYDATAKENHNNGEDPEPRLYRAMARIIETE